MLTGKRDKVAVLITAESIIAGFMIAYGASLGPNLVYWSDLSHPGSLLTTYSAGLLIYGIVLTCLVSVLLLFESLDTETDDVRYRWGYRLFVAAIFLSCGYVGVNVSSIYQFTISTDHKPADIASWLGLSDRQFVSLGLGVFFVGVFFLLAVVLYVLKVAPRERRKRNDQAPRLILEDNQFSSTDNQGENQKNQKTRKRGDGANNEPKKSNRTSKQQ